jgi:hypothetical protein
MKNNQLMGIINQNLGIHKNNCKTFIDFMIALQKSRTVNLKQMVNYSGKVKIVHECKLTQDRLAECMLKMFDLLDCKLTLAMDRTNWRYGKKDINLLVLSCCALGTSIPLYWVELDTRGSSNNSERQQVLNMFIKKFGADKIDYLIADREFIGKNWFEYLHDNNIKFIVRIKQNIWLQQQGVKIKGSALFKNVTQQHSQLVQVMIDDLTLIAQATRSPKNELVIVVSNHIDNDELVDFLKIYSKRWQIECLFANLKTKGFNFEDTHVTKKNRIGNLTKLIILSFAVCYLLGLVRASVAPIIIKKHGYKQNSFFRYGLDLMIQLLNGCFNQALSVLIICFSFITLEKKASLLVSVM